ncbi:hypothetical protein DFJ74DRAFT_661157 [Hyaloraphidium curvatum]|nr:hypothetical protein DFJ74DRAFT_661157 [Hyaloraphidium curvatum]
MRRPSQKCTLRPLPAHPSPAMSGEEVDGDALLAVSEITGVELGIARSYLQVADGSVETAIQLILDNGGAPLDGGGGGANRPTSPEVVDDDDDVVPVAASRPPRPRQDEVRAPMQRRVRDTLVGGDAYSNSYGSDYGSFMPGPAARMNAGSSAGYGQSPGGAIHEAFRDLEAESRPTASSSSDRANRLAEMYKPPTDIMFPGDFEQARIAARERKKWILVNPQAADEFACQLLNRDLWKDQDVKDFVRENFIFLQFGSQTPEGTKYASFYPFDSFPHIAIVDPRTAERMKVWTTLMSPSEFMYEAMEFLEGNSLDENPKNANANANAGRKRKAKSVAEMTEEEQILAAMEASMAGAAPSRTESRPAVVTLDAEEPIALDDDEEPPPDAGASPFASIKAVKRAEVPATGDATRVQIRMPDGSKFVRRFLKTDPVRHIFEFVKSEVPDASDRVFELIFERKSLIDRLDSNIADAGLLNAALNVSWDE